MKYFTLQDVMDLKPCHNKDKLLTYMAGRKKISLAGILNSKALNIDKIWLTVRLMPVDKAVEFAQWCADSVKHLDNIYAADVVCVADVAADYVARVAYAAAAAYDAAYDAAAYDAAYEADAYAAAAAAAYAAAAYAARKAQVNKLKELTN